MIGHIVEELYPNTGQFFFLRSIRQVVELNDGIIPVFIMDGAERFFLQLTRGDIISDLEDAFFEANAAG